MARDGSAPHAAFESDKRTSLAFEISAHGGMPSTGGARHAIERTPKLIDVSIIFRKSWWWGNVDLPVVSIAGEKVSLHECLTDIYVVTKHMMLGSQGENCAETACMRHRAESIFKIASTRIIFSAHVLSLYDQTDFAVFKLSVFALDLVVKPRGENFVLRSEGGAKDFYPALATIESVHLGFLGHQPGELERTAEHLVTVFGILHAPCVALRRLGRVVFIRKFL
jgi:hypothetical protein